MSEATTAVGDEAPRSGHRPLRIWPPIALLVIMVVARIIPKVVTNGPANLWMSAAFGPALCGILIVLWWLAASRATWKERLFGLIGMVVAVTATIFLMDKSVLGPAMTVLTIPMGTAAFAVGAILAFRSKPQRRTLIAVLLATLGFGFSTLIRSEGLWGDFAMDLHWRWNPSAEQRMLAARGAFTPADKPTFSEEQLQEWLAVPEWPEFRGPNRDSRQTGIRSLGDWNANPPQQLWKIAIGPGWSSFAVAGKLLFTQEQRGPGETVVCYDADSGREVWTYQTETRFEDTLGGPGPRATPTLAGGGLFVLGANGHLIRLDPKSGTVVWSGNIHDLSERDAKPMWGYCASPLVVGQAVVVHAGGEGDKGTFAFDVDSGQLLWSAPAGDHSYSSPQLAEIGGEMVVMMLTNAGIRFLDPASGDVRFQYEWEYNNYRALQPHVIGQTVLLPTGMGTGTRRIRISIEDGKWSAEEMWTSLRLKPDFNDFVVKQSQLYGFDGGVLTCIDLETGERIWKGGRYGKGQILLLADAGVLLVAGEYGQVILVEASPEGHQELAKIEAIEGKTWNHPVVVGDRLYIRNSQQAACFQLPAAGSDAAL